MANNSIAAFSFHTSAVKLHANGNQLETADVVFHPSMFHCKNLGPTFSYDLFPMTCKFNITIGNFL